MQGNNTQAAKPSAAGAGPSDAPGTAPSRHAAGSGADGRLASADRHFVRAASAAGKAEIDEAQLALVRSSNADVKSFAQMIIDDHSKANDQLEAIATVQPAAGRPSSNATAIAKLRDLDGEAFDKAYLQDQIRAHHQAVALFAQEAKSGHDPKLRRFASATLLILKKHRKLASELAVKA